MPEPIYSTNNTYWVCGPVVGVVSRDSVDVVPGYPADSRLAGEMVGVGKVGSEVAGRTEGVMELILICDTLEGSVSLSPNTV